MLVLSRKLSEEILIGSGLIKITVLDIKGDKVRLGFEAPNDIEIDRKEVFEAKMKKES